MSADKTTNDTDPSIPPAMPAPLALVKGNARRLDVIESRLGGIEDSLAVLEKRPPPADLGSLPFDVAVLKAGNADLQQSMGKLTDALLGDGDKKTGLVTRMDRVERSQAWVARGFWILLAALVGAGVAGKLGWIFGGN